MRGKFLMFVGIVLGCAQLAQASGGPTEEIRAECRFKNGSNDSLLAFDLFRNYTSELKGRAYFYQNAAALNAMTTSMETCLQHNLLRLVNKEPIPEKTAWAVVCGSGETKPGQKPSLTPNKAGFLTSLWQESSGKIQAHLSGPSLDVTASCTVKKE